MCIFLWGELQKRAGEEHMKVPSCSSCRQQGPIPGHSQFWTVPCLSILWAAFMLREGAYPRHVCSIVTFLLWDIGKSFKEYVCHRVQLCKEKSDFYAWRCKCLMKCCSARIDLESPQCKGMKTMDNVRGILHAKVMHVFLISFRLSMAKTCWRGK